MDTLMQLHKELTIGSKIKILPKEGNTIINFDNKKMLELKKPELDELNDKGFLKKLYSVLTDYLPHWELSKQVRVKEWKIFIEAINNGLSIHYFMLFNGQYYCIAFAFSMSQLANWDLHDLEKNIESGLMDYSPRFTQSAAQPHSSTQSDIRDKTS